MFSVEMGYTNVKLVLTCLSGAWVGATFLLHSMSTNKNFHLVTFAMND